ncbi:MAG: methyltransferase domain-containing protein [Myxococcales bacterium]
MWKELGHFFANAPGVLCLKARLSQEALYDVVMERMDVAGLGRERERLVHDVRGAVLEVGCGTGLMFRHYHMDVDLTALELDARFLRVAGERVHDHGVRVRLIQGDATKLPFDDGSFDFVVVALMLCSVPEPAAVLREIRRVLRRGGELRLLEHVRSPGRVAGRLMDLVDPAWLVLNGQGCHLNRDPGRALVETGFRVVEERALQIFSTALPAFPMRAIRAVP